MSFAIDNQVTPLSSAISKPDIHFINMNASGSKVLLAALFARTNGIAQVCITKSDRDFEIVLDTAKHIAQYIDVNSTTYAVLISMFISNLSTHKMRIVAGAGMTATATGPLSLPIEPESMLKINIVLRGNPGAEVSAYVCDASY